MSPTRSDEFTPKKRKRIDEDVEDNREEDSEPPNTTDEKENIESESEYESENMPFAVYDCTIRKKIIAFIYLGEAKGIITTTDPHKRVVEIKFEIERPKEITVTKLGENLGIPRQTVLQYFIDANVPKVVLKKCCMKWPPAAASYDDAKFYDGWLVLIFDKIFSSEKRTQTIVE